MSQENQELLQAIGQMMDARFAEYDKKMDARFAEYDKKMDARFAAFKEELLQETGKQTMVLMESYFQPQFNLLSEKIDGVLDKVAPMEAVLEQSERLDHVEAVVIDLTRRVEALEQRG